MHLRYSSLDILFAGRDAQGLKRDSHFKHSGDKIVYKQHHLCSSVQHSLTIKKYKFSYLPI